MAHLPIDLTQLSEQELVDLNRKIVERLRFLRDVRAHHHMLELRPGDRVSFSPEAGKKVVGTILRLNRKSVSVVDSDGIHWRVAPSFLSRAEMKDVDAEVTAKEMKPEAPVASSQQLQFVPLTTSFSHPADVPRNAPCPCGSGKKYKRCCLLKAAAGNR